MESSIFESQTLSLPQFTIVHNIVAYKALKEVPLDGYDPGADETRESTDRQTPIKLEKVRKLIKTHRCVMDFDLKFIMTAPA